MESKAYALRELYQLRRVELLIELGLSRQDDPQHLRFGGLHAREQANLLENAHGQVLRLVHDEQHLAAGRVLLDQKVVERRNQLGLLHFEGREAELHQQALEEIDRRDLRLIDLGDHDVGLDFFQKRFNQGGLARAD